MSTAPMPLHLSTARQFFSPDGSEIFFCEAYGRRPDVRDALRVMGWGPNRISAEKSATDNWRAAWRSLQNKSQQAPVAGA